MPQGAGGYNIPVSVSAASTFSVPNTFNQPFYLSYGSGNRQGGDIAQDPQNINPATATSSAAEGDAGSSSSGSGVSGLLTSGSNTEKYVLIGMSVLGVILAGVGIYLAIKHRK